MLLDTLLAVRRRSETLIAPLEPEDLMLQGMADASPPKWHLGHTNWFFDTFVLQPHAAGHRACDPLWSYQFNSYYVAIRARHPNTAMVGICCDYTRLEQLPRHPALDGQRRIGFFPGSSLGNFTP